MLVCLSLFFGYVSICYLMSEYVLSMLCEFKSDYVPSLNLLVCSEIFVEYDLWKITSVVG